MSRFRVYPTTAQATAMTEHCAQARFVWNLALEQWNFWRSERPYSPCQAEQSRQLTEARADNSWLASGSSIVQQQALRDFDQAKANFFARTHKRPTWRTKGRNEGFRVVGKQAQHVRRLNGRWSEVQIPKVGWVRFRRSRAVPESKSYRVTLDRAGRWHIAFAVIPKSISGPSDNSIIGIDRGVAITLTLSNGVTYRSPTDRNVKRLQQHLSRAKKESKRREKIRIRLAKAHARNADARKDWIEKTSTTVAQTYDLIYIEDLRVKNMVRSAKGTIEKPGNRVRQKAGLNKAILSQGWSMFATRLDHKAFDRVERVNPAFTSQRCSACGHIARESRKSQALFSCVACGHTANADVNAAMNIAAGHAVTARRGLGVVNLPLKREPQLEFASS